MRWTHSAFSILSFRLWLDQRECIGTMCICINTWLPWVYCKLTGLTDAFVIVVIWIFAPAARYNYLSYIKIGVYTYFDYSFVINVAVKFRWSMLFQCLLLQFTTNKIYSQMFKKVKMRCGRWPLWIFRCNTNAICIVVSFIKCLFCTNESGVWIAIGTMGIGRLCVNAQTVFPTLHSNLSIAVNYCINIFRIV